MQVLPASKDVQRNQGVITTINSSSRTGQHVSPAGQHYQQQQMQYQQQHLHQRQTSNPSVRGQITVNGYKSSDLNENSPAGHLQQPVRGSLGHIMKQQQPTMQTNSMSYNSSPSKMTNPNMVPITGQAVMHGSYQTNPSVKSSSHNMPSHQYPNHPSTAIIYTSEQGPGCMIISH